ncbi:hypothetical protein FSP39_015904 [Pinctada imbricata]|uniref:Aldehyde oxidase/xanthine dehydrogenase a/b hammerhead domain-containing protein n=1 Tax=Pinctada imbricata TaxID=66713 RepID=A0AA88YIL9_PINIB|nr:hypothetical protein FSP39_015904 [Pinctada imbricata]
MAVIREGVVPVLLWCHGLMVPPRKSEGWSDISFVLFDHMLSICNFSLDNRDTLFTSEDHPLWTTPCFSTQVIEDVPSDQSENDPVGRPLPLVTGHGLATGEAQFVDDIPEFKDELHLSPVCSTKVHAKIVSVDASEALVMPGVVGYYDHTSVIGQNKFGVFVQDEELFASEAVLCFGQMIGVIAATSEAMAKKASRQVKVEYKELKPIITIQDAIRENSFYPYASVPVHIGNVDLAFTQAQKFIEGEVNTGAQEHHYMEPISAIAVPKNEDKEIEIYVTTQSIMFVMQSISALLNVPSNRVTVKHRRTAYILRFFSRTGRPVRFVLDRRLDMILTGKRHSYLMKYKAGIDKEGRISAVDFKLFSNAGCSLDISPDIMDTTLRNMDGCYNIPNFRIEGHLCRTNILSSTSFRGFGVPQGMVALETMIEHIAKATGKTQEEVRLQHHYKENDVSVYNMKMKNCNIQKCWDQCVINKHSLMSGEQRSKSTIALSTCPDALQGSALINIHIDGTVKLTHGGCEIGQGINTKMIQVASRCLGIPVEKIYVSHATSDVIPNPSATAGSATSDIIGAAVMNGCNELLERLRPLREEQPDISWEKLVCNCVVFASTALIDGGNWNSQTGSGRPCNYYTLGVGCCTVEIDSLTGDHQVLSMDIVMDVGKSLNPAIDIGQIEGAFIMGYGMMTVEDMKWTPDGVQISNGPINYKVPGVRNIPREFRVSLLKDCPNPKAVYSSKGIGEPPLLLSVAVYLALKEAITAARVANGHSEIFQLDCPVTAERIQKACSG